MSSIFYSLKVVQVKVFFFLTKNRLCLINQIKTWPVTCQVKHFEESFIFCCFFWPPIANKLDNYSSFFRDLFSILGFWSFFPLFCLFCILCGCFKLIKCRYSWGRWMHGLCYHLVNAIKLTKLITLSGIYVSLLYSML